jgi:hypothetical protein
MSVQGMPRCCCGTVVPPLDCIFLEDNFNRANSSDLNVSGPNGWTWVEQAGSWAIAGNTLQTTSVDGRVYIINTNGFVDYPQAIIDEFDFNFRIDVDIKANNSNSQPIVYKATDTTFVPTLGCELDYANGKVRIIVVTDDARSVEAECDFDLDLNTFYHVSLCVSTVQQFVGFLDTNLHLNFVSVAIDGITLLRGIFTYDSDGQGYGLGTGDDHEGTATFDNFQVSVPSTTEAEEPNPCSTCGECCWPYTGDPQEAPEELVATIVGTSGFTFCPNADACNDLDGSSYTLFKTDNKRVIAYDGIDCATSNYAVHCLIYEADITPFACDPTSTYFFDKLILMIGSIFPGNWNSGVVIGSCYMRIGFYVSAEQLCADQEPTDPVPTIYIWTSPSFGEWSKVASSQQPPPDPFCSFPITLDTMESNPCSVSYVEITLP